MATGSGKTRTVIALIDMMMRAERLKRALFLADRVALVNQAVKAFKAHLPGRRPSISSPTRRRLSLRLEPIDDEFHRRRPRGETARFGPGHFDLIVIDEAHRSVLSALRRDLHGTDSHLIGLTATPKDEISRNTYGLFDLEDGVSTDACGLDKAVEDEFLGSRPSPSSRSLKFVREAIR